MKGFILHGKAAGMMLPRRCSAQSPARSSRVMQMKMKGWLPFIAFRWFVRCFGGRLKYAAAPIALTVLLTAQWGGSDGLRLEHVGVARAAVRPPAGHDDAIARTKMEQFHRLLLAVVEHNVGRIEPAADGRRNAP